MIPSEVWDLLKMLWPLIALQYGLVIWALVDLVRRPRVRHLPKIAWGALILFVSFFGSIAYLLLGREEV
ncbi:MAG: PLD nuclease N-terminal domain-containing protein [Bacillota bacterium]